MPKVYRPCHVHVGPESPPGEFPLEASRLRLSGSINGYRDGPITFSDRVRVGPIRLADIWVSREFEFRGVALTDVSFDSFKPMGMIWFLSCLFDRVVLRGRLPTIEIIDAAPEFGQRGPPLSAYDSIPWALDIREAEPREMELGCGTIPRDKMLFRPDQVAVFDMRFADAFSQIPYAVDGIAYPAVRPIAFARRASAPVAYVYNDPLTQQRGTLSWLRDKGWAT